MFIRKESVLEILRQWNIIYDIEPYFEIYIIRDVCTIKYYDSSDYGFYIWAINYKTTTDYIDLHYIGVDYLFLDLVNRLIVG